jgi:rhamnose utilization protein RhaD (predicted bifunctional aldolase and dehydrogenase)/NAD(P)-dependent dehydrogenase (short-subunit alcohol dehydrogenase family)
MENYFNEKEARAAIEKYPSFPPELALRIYTSRLIGGDNNLVLYGGGNTSVKLRQKNIVSEETDILFVKASGWDLAAIEPQGFAGLNLEPLRKLRRLESLADEEMDNQLKINKIAAAAPDPSVEALVHAFLPHKFVDHTHADAVLTLTNQKRAEELIQDALGPTAAVVPYVMSGLPLARAVVEAFERNSDVRGVVVLHHGIFTFAEDAKTSYASMIDFVTAAEAFIRERIGSKPLFSIPKGVRPIVDIGKTLARLAPVVRGACARSSADGKAQHFIVESRASREIADASLSEEAEEICASGVLTPDHVILTKNRMAYLGSVPDDVGLKAVVETAVESYKESYLKYFREHADSAGLKPPMSDPFPRVFLASGVGLLALGRTRNEAVAAADIAEHTVHVKLEAGAVGGYEPIAEAHVFDMEYWPLQQKKLQKLAVPPLQGRIALITGAGGAIGLGVADRLLDAGAVVVLSDIAQHRLDNVHDTLAGKYESGRIEILALDVTDYGAVEEAFSEACRRLGGIDVLVPNAGIAHVAKIEDLEPAKFEKVVAVNLMGTFNVIKASIPVFRRQGSGGNIVVVSSKNVFDPGAAFGAYSASKAGAHQISKIAALELAELGVRVNMVNPDAVFGDERVSSQLWDLIGPERMKSRGLDAEGLREYYRQRNLLKERVLGEHVGNAVVFFATNQTPTTGATLPIDGGIPSAFPR